MRKTLVAILCLTFVSALAQRENIVSFRDNLVLTSVLNTKSESFDFTGSNGQVLEYSTAPITGFGFGVDYKWLTFEYTKRLNSFSNEGLYGHTENFGIGFGFTMPKWYFRNFLESYNGYHITNPDLVRFNYLDSVGRYPYRPDIETFRYYAATNWIFNSDTYSSMASLWQLERQESSAGSWVSGLTFSYSAIVGDSAFIPSVQAPNFESVKDINVVSSSMLTVNGGYQYTLVLSNSRKWFVHLGLTPGLGVHWGGTYSNRTDEARDIPSRLAFSNEGRFIVGYNGDKWYFGYSALSYATVDAGGINPVSGLNNYNRFYLGYRFTLPKKIVNGLEKIGL